MATPYELRQQELAKQQQQTQLIRGITGEATGFALKQVGYQRPFLASAIDVLSGIGIAAWSFVTQRKQQKKRQRLLQGQQATLDSVDKLLQEIQEVGTILVTEHGISPLNEDFEKLMAQNLYDSIGYIGYCNMKAWMPGSKPGDPNRAVWFVARNGGRDFQPVNMQDLPPNIGLHWYVTCRNFKDIWATQYQDMLIQEGRLRELEQFQEDYNRGKWVLRIAFGAIFGIFGILMLYYGTKVR